MGKITDTIWAEICDRDEKERQLKHEIYMKDKGEWLVAVFGEPESHSFEITLCRKHYFHGLKSYGWMNEDKLLITHNGGPCHWPLKKFIWDKMIALAEELAKELNEKEGRGVIANHYTDKQRIRRHVC